MKIFFLLVLLFLSSNLFCKEELIVIQTVSLDKKSFVIQLGKNEGITKGQEIVFSNELSSIVCKAIEVSRDYSLWVPLDVNMIIPFNRQDIVGINTHSYGNVALDVDGTITKMLPEEKFEKKEFEIRKMNSINIKYSYGGAISQTLSSVDSSQYSKKKGQDFTFEHGIRFSPEFELAIGGRIDYELYRKNLPLLDIPTNRNILIASFLYHFVNFSNGPSNFYTGITFGIGSSNTTVDSEDHAGICYILPQVKFGHLLAIAPTVAFITEASVESITSHEKLADGSKQDDSIINAKVSVGIRF